MADGEQTSGSAIRRIPRGFCTASGAALYAARRAPRAVKHTGTGPWRSAPIHGVWTYQAEVFTLNSESKTTVSDTLPNNGILSAAKFIVKKVGWMNENEYI